MEHERVIAAVCRLPVDFRSVGDKSMLDLFQASGAGAVLDSITPEALAAHLRRHPELIEAWRGDSDDRRTPSGPYLRAPRRAGRPWIVGWHPEGTRLTYPDGPTACAAFILARLHEFARI